MRKLLVSLLSIMMVVALATPTFADDGKTGGYCVVTNDGSETCHNNFSEALGSAKDGDTIKLPESAKLTDITKAVSLQGVDGGTQVDQQVVYKIDDNNPSMDKTINISNLNINAGNVGDTAIMVTGNNTSGTELDKATFNIENCYISDIKSGVGAHVRASNVTFNVTNTTMYNVWCAAMVDDSLGNKVGSLSLNSDSKILYAVQSYNVDRSAANKHDMYYQTFEDYENDPNRENGLPGKFDPNYDSSPDKVDDNWNDWMNAVASIGNKYYTDINEAISDANDGDTIELLSDSYDFSNVYFSKAVSLKGQTTSEGGPSTTILGGIWYTGESNSTGEMINIENLVIVNNTQKDDPIAGITFGGNSRMSDIEVNVRNCQVRDFLFGVAANTRVTGFDINVSDTLMDHVWTAVSVRYGNAVGGLSLDPESTVNYEVQAFGGEIKDRYYDSIEEYTADEGIWQAGNTGVSQPTGWGTADDVTVTINISGSTEQAEISGLKVGDKLTLAMVEEAIETELGYDVNVVSVKDTKTNSEYDYEPLSDDLTLDVSVEKVTSTTQEKPSRPTYRPSSPSKDLPSNTKECQKEFGDEYIWSDEYDACVIKFMIVDTSTK